ncbi:MAG: transaldolase [Rhodocyclaceae bacterium]|nr:transaldolase [Rhodocyclaceae bacterium]MDZ4213915.1 transaldolase [Rhodocyclaceae bacterium]
MSMNANPLRALKALGQHVWLDNLSRALLQEGSLQRMMTEDGVDGVTSNPAIFQKAIAGSTYYQDELVRLRNSPLDAEARYESLVIPDIQAACDMLLPAYVATQGDAGYVSLEVSPALAHDTAGTVLAAQRLRHSVGRENLFIKVPGTPAGVQAFEQLTAAGERINVTLIFSLTQYAAVAQAYLRGAQRWLDDGGNAAQLRSVASVFLSRVDTQVDQRLDAMNTPPARMLRGKAGVALAKCCHARYLEIFHGLAFATLAQAGVRAQTPLWASTGNKDPAYSDLRYVEPLIGPETINTVPDATLAAIRDHGHAAATLTTGKREAHDHIEALQVLGIDLGEVGETLQTDGVRLFSEAYEQILMSCRSYHVI